MGELAARAWLRTKALPLTCLMKLIMMGTAERVKAGASHRIISHVFILVPPDFIFLPNQKSTLMGAYFEHI